MVDGQLLDVFLNEADEHLSALESDLLSLEEQPDNKEIINHVFRHAHSLKGSAGLVGFHQIAEIMHIVENHLDKLRNSEMQVDQELISSLLYVVDVFRNFFSRFGSHKHETVKKSSENNVESLRCFLIDSLGKKDNGNDLLTLKQSGKKIQNRIKEWQSRQASQTNGARPKPEMKIGEMLVEQGIITSKDVQEVLYEQKKTGEILLKKGKITETQLKENLERQFKERESLRSKVIKVDIEKLDKLEKLVNQLWNGFAQVNLLLKTQGSSQQVSFSVGESLEEVGMGIHMTILSMRLVNIEEAFPSFKRVIRDLASQQGKKIQMITQGGEIQIDKSVLESMFDPISHLLRNAVKHGIELPRERFLKGKEEIGTIWLKISKTPKSIFIEVADDGRGIDNKEVLRKAAKMGLLDNREVTDDCIYDLLFQPGLTTNEGVDGCSGRGVGLDVVKRNVIGLGGSIKVTSEKENGTHFGFEFPLESVIRKPIFSKSNQCLHSVS